MKRSTPFLILSTLLLVILGMVLMKYDKAQLHLMMNAYHTPALDYFFRYYTYVGEWVPYVIVVGLLFYKAGWASFLLTDVLLSGLIAQRLKYVFNTDRPYYYFAQNLPDVQLPFVDGVTLSKWYSFPSGHTVTFFAMFLTLALILTEMLNCNSQKQSAIRNLLINFVCFLLAVLGAYSRIYLSQHFAEDIFGGAIIGIITTILLYIAVPYMQNKPFWDWKIRKMQKK